MSTEHVDRLRTAIAAAQAGDTEPLAALFAPAIEWRGITTGYLWWRRTPICQGSDEARAVLQQWNRSGDPSERAVDATVIGAEGDRVIVELHLPEGDLAQPHTLYEVLTFRDGQVIDIQDCGSREAAFDFAGSAQ